MSRKTAALIRCKVNARVGIHRWERKIKARRAPRAKAGMKSGGEDLNIPHAGEYSRFDETLSVWITPDSIRMNFSCGRNPPVGRTAVHQEVTSSPLSFCLTENRRGKTTCRAEATWVDRRAWEIRSCTYDCDNVSRFPPTKTVTNLEAECDTTARSVYNSALSNLKSILCREIVSYKAIKFSSTFYVDLIKI